MVVDEKHSNDICFQMLLFDMFAQAIVCICLQHHHTLIRLRSDKDGMQIMAAWYMQSVLDLNQLRVWDVLCASNSLEKMERV